MLNSEYIKNLNKAQKEAVMHLDGPLLIVAGAGSGKTKVLTTRIANIIREKKAYPNQILAVTFTNKAALEMKKRISEITSESISRNIWMGTFHSIFARILRSEAPLITFGCSVKLSVELTKPVNFTQDLILERSPLQATFA